MIKRNLRTVVACRSRRAGRLFSRKRVVPCQSRLVVLEKYEAYNEACSDLVARSLRGHFQVRVTAVRVRVHVGSLTPTISDHLVVEESQFS